MLKDVATKGCSRVQAVELKGARVVRALRRSCDPGSLLVDVGLDDGREEFLWRIVAVQEDVLLLRDDDSARTRRMTFALAADATFVAPEEHALIIAVTEAVDPREHALEQALQSLRPYLRGDLLNEMDAPLILEAVRHAAAGRLPDRAARVRQASAIKVNRQWRLGAGVARDWLKLAQEGQPAFDIDMDLGVFLRHAGEPKAALAAIQEALKRQPPPSLREESILRTQCAALFADLFERGKQRDPDLLSRAWREAYRARDLATSAAGGRDVHDEFSTLFARLGAFG